MKAPLLRVPLVDSLDDSVASGDGRGRMDTAETPPVFKEEP